MNGIDDIKKDDDKLEKKIDELDTPSLLLILKNLRSSYQALVVANSLNNLKETHKMKITRKYMARILTIINSRKDKNKKKINSQG